jgi:hypothetical protein
MSILTGLKNRLTNDTEAVCRAYLPEGWRQGRYWIAGDVQGNPGRSMWVNLAGPHRGNWTDAASAEYGDLLDLIRLNKGLSTMRETLDEARRFLNESRPANRPFDHDCRIHNSSAAARKLYRLSKPVRGTLAETYLRSRAITAKLSWPALRFHPECYFRDHERAPLETWPALIAAVTDLSGNLTGLQRTYLARDGSAKAPFDEPRRAMGHLLGHAVRFGKVSDVMAAGEGLETVLSLLSLFPFLPMAAALSVRHLAAMHVPAGLRRLYVLRENDEGGATAERLITARCAIKSVECLMLISEAKDLNGDLRAGPAQSVRKRMAAQLLAEDRSRFAS